MTVTASATQLFWDKIFVYGFGVFAIGLVVYLLLWILIKGRNPLGDKKGGGK